MMHMKKIALTNNSPFVNCVTKVNDMFIDCSDDLQVVMSMYNLLQYSKSYRKTTGSLWNYY